MKNTQRNELAVCGFAAVKILEKNHPEKIRRLYFTAEVAPKFGGLCKKMAKNHGIYNQKPSKDLEKLCGSVHHQGVVAMIESPAVEPLDFVLAEKWAKNGEDAVLLDRIGNANNFGAIVRSAAFFGIKNIVSVPVGVHPTPNHRLRGSIAFRDILARGAIGDPEIPDHRKRRAVGRAGMGKIAPVADKVVPVC